jgi:hypothetical protein
MSTEAVIPNAEIINANANISEEKPLENAVVTEAAVKEAEPKKVVETVVDAATVVVSTSAPVADAPKPQQHQKKHRHHRHQQITTHHAYWPVAGATYYPPPPIANGWYGPIPPPNYTHMNGTHKPKQPEQSQPQPQQQQQVSQPSSQQLQIQQQQQPTQHISKHNARRQITEIIGQDDQAYIQQPIPYGGQLNCAPYGGGFLNGGPVVDHPYAGYSHGFGRSMQQAPQPLGAYHHHHHHHAQQVYYPAAPVQLPQQQQKQQSFNYNSQSYIAQQSPGSYFSNGSYASSGFQRGY